MCGVVRCVNSDVGTSFPSPPLKRRDDPYSPTNTAQWVRHRSPLAVCCRSGRPYLCLPYADAYAPPVTPWRLLLSKWTWLIDLQVDSVAALVRPTGRRSCLAEPHVDLTLEGRANSTSRLEPSRTTCGRCPTTARREDAGGLEARPLSRLEVRVFGQLGLYP